MSHRFVASLALPALLALDGSLGSAQTPAGSPNATLPSTLVGRTVGEWLAAFNSGDSLRLGAYYRKWHLDRSLANQMQRRNETGGFDLVSIEKTEPRLLEFVVKERNSARTAYGIMEIGPGDTTLRQSALMPMENGESPASFRIDAATRARVVENAIAQLDTNYVFPDVAAKMAAAVRAKLKSGDYNAVSNGATFALRLTDDLQAVSHDKHLRVNFAASPIPDRRNGPPPPEDQERFRRQMERVNCGFVKTELLPGNVGYLKFNFFGDPDVCGPTASAAMNFLAGADALIVDLRENGGGSPGMVAYVCSYLFSERTHLNDLWTRRTNETREFWTREVPGKKFGGNKPVFVLTSSRTFSGAEEFTYNLKNLKRATIVGETTGGGAHPVSGHKIDEHFAIGVPFARAINPISRTNWEGTGVEPDVKVPAAEALATAQKLIADKSSP